MYSKEEAAKLRQDFWVSFGKSFPNKWILYRTKVKPIQFKFYFDNKKAMVCMDIEGDQQEIEKYGVIFIRFSNEEIKNNMFSVILSLESKIEELKAERRVDNK